MDVSEKSQTSHENNLPFCSADFNSDCSDSRNSFCPLSFLLRLRGFVFLLLVTCMTGVQGDGEGGAEGGGEVKGMALASHCPVKGQTLGCQGG